MIIVHPPPTEFSLKVRRYLEGTGTTWSSARLGVSSHTVRNVVLLNHEPKASTKQIMEDYMEEHPYE